MEEFTLSLAGSVYLRIDFSDRSARTVRRHAISNSQVMSQLLMSLDEGTVMTSHAPAGFLSAWLDAISAAREDFSMQDTETLITALKAADFVDDKSVFDRLCVVLSCRLLAPSSVSQIHRFSSKRQRTGTDGHAVPQAEDDRKNHANKRRNGESLSTHQILEQLPSHLAISVLQSSNSFPLRDLLQKLPQSHHPLALQAHFPSVTREHRLDIYPTSLATPGTQDHFLPRLLTAAKVLTSLQSLHVGVCWKTWRQLETPKQLKLEIETGTCIQMPASVCAAFESMLQDMPHLTSLCLGKPDDFSFLKEASECSSEAEYSQLLPSVCHSLASILPTLTSLRSLRLEGDCSRPEACQELLEALQSCTNLQQLALRHVEIVSRDENSSPSDCEIMNSKVGEIVEESPEQQASSSKESSQELHSDSGYQIDSHDRHISAPSTGVWAFGAAVARMTGLQSLTMSYALLDQAALRPLQRSMHSSGPRAGALQHLTRLCLRGSSCRGAPPGVDPSTSNNLQDLGAILQHMTSLEHLDLKLCGLTTSRVHLLAPAFQSLQKLRYIDMGENELGYRGIWWLSVAWGCLKHVQTLKLDGVLWGGPAFESATDSAPIMQLVDSIAQFSMLQHLSLERLGVVSEADDTCALALAEALGQSSSLRSISLRCITWKAASMKALVTALGNHKSLCSLVIDAFSHHSRVDCSAQISAFNSGASELGSLTKLVIHCRARVASLTELAALTGLRELELKSLKVPDKLTCVAVAKGLIELTGLQRLVLLEPGISTQNAAYLAPALGMLTELTELVLDIESKPGAVVNGLGRGGAGCSPGSKIHTIAAEVASLQNLKVLDIGRQGQLLRPAEIAAIYRALLGAGRCLDMFNGSKWSRTTLAVSYPWA